VILSAVVSAFLTAAVILGVLRLAGGVDQKYSITFDRNSVNAENIEKFKRVKEIIKNDYYMDVDENTLLEGAVSGLAESLNDPYTVYFNKEQMRLFLEKSEGSYVGIGITVTTDEDGLLTIVEPMSGSPAEAAGLKQNDKIVKVDDKDVTSLKDENMVISMIKGPEGTKVKLTVYRESEGRYIDFELKRAKIKMTNINSEILDNDIGYIKLSMFDREIADYFNQHLNRLKKESIKGLIIDLRDNPGGSYDQVVKIADKILPEGLIVYTEDRNKRRQEQVSDSRELDIPITVLINGKSASASEILAGAIKDHKKGTLVGTKTFGKGLVQELKMLDDGSGIKVTVSRYFTPSGKSIHGVGIEPDIKVEMLPEYANYPASKVPREKDTQLKKALETTRSEIEKKNQTGT